MCQSGPQTRTPDPSLELLFPEQVGMRPLELVGSVGVFQDWAWSLAHFLLRARSVSFLPWAARKVSQAKAGAKAAGCLFLLDGACNSIPWCQVLEIADENISTTVYSGQRRHPTTVLSRFIIPKDRERGAEGRKTASQPARFKFNLRSLY